MLTRQNPSIPLAVAGFATIAFAQPRDEDFAAPYGLDPVPAATFAQSTPPAPQGFAELARRIEVQGQQIWEMDEEDGVQLLIDTPTGAEIRRKERGR